MVLTLEISSEPDLKWNDRLLKSNYGTIYQTKEIAQYFEKTSGYRHSYLRFLDQTGNIVGQLLVSEQDISTKKSIKNFLKKIVRKFLLLQKISHTKMTLLILS